MRGKQCKRPKNTENYRITPADAGKTMCGDCSDLAVGDHPRGCGENCAIIIVHARRTGSPPRMRGKPSVSQLFRWALRITPADAGKTFAHFVYFFLRQDHPRGCGENEIADDIIRRCGGSPPRMRGKLQSFSTFRVSYRITPADAGKTSHCRFPFQM